VTAELNEMLQYIGDGYDGISEWFKYLKLKKACDETDAGISSLAPTILRV